MTFTQICPPWTIGVVVLPTGPLQLHMVATTTGDFRPGSAGRPAPGVAWPPAPPPPETVGAAPAGAGAPEGPMADGWPDAVGRLVVPVRPGFEAVAPGVGMGA